MNIPVFAFYIFVVFYVLFPAEGLQAAQWQNTVLQKANAAKTMAEIKSHVLVQSPENKKTISYVKQLKTIQKNQAQLFAEQTREVFPLQKDRELILSRYEAIQKQLNQLKPFVYYALEVQHPADLFTASNEEIQLLLGVLNSFRTGEVSHSAEEPSQIVQFSSGASVISFERKGKHAIHLAFKPQQFTLKIAIGDMPLSGQEFGPKL